MMPWKEAKEASATANKEVYHRDRRANLPSLQDLDITETSEGLEKI